MKESQQFSIEHEVAAEHESLRTLYVVVALELAASIATLYALTRWAA